MSLIVKEYLFNNMRGEARFSSKLESRLGRRRDGLFNNFLLTNFFSTSIKLHPNSNPIKRFMLFCFHCQLYLKSGEKCAFCALTMDIFLFKFLLSANELVCLLVNLVTFYTKQPTRKLS